jgi:hypothetical protein
MKGSLGGDGGKFDFWVFSASSSIIITEMQIKAKGNISFKLRNSEFDMK